MDWLESLVFECMTAMALSSPGIVYVIAFRATPVIRTRHIVAKTIFLLPILGLRLITLLAFVTKIKIQKRTPWTYPLPVLLLLTTTTVTIPTIRALTAVTTVPRPRP